LFNPPVQPWRHAGPETETVQIKKMGKQEEDKRSAGVADIGVDGGQATICYLSGNCAIE